MARARYEIKSAGTRGNNTNDDADDGRGWTRYMFNLSAPLPEDAEAGLSSKEAAEAAERNASIAARLSARPDAAHDRAIFGASTATTTATLEHQRSAEREGPSTAGAARADMFDEAPVVVSEAEVTRARTTDASVVVSASAAPVPKWRERALARKAAAEAERSTF